METLVNEEQVCERVSTPVGETTNDVAMRNNEAVDCPTVGTDQSSSTVFTLGLENLDMFVRCCDTSESRDIRYVPIKAVSEGGSMESRLPTEISLTCFTFLFVFNH